MSNGNHSCRFLSQGRLSVLIKAEEGNLTDKDRVRRAGLTLKLAPAGGEFGRGQGRSGSCGTFLELSELDEVQNSALCAAGPRFLRTPQLGWAGQARVPRPPPAGAESLEPTAEPSGDPLVDEQSVLGWKRRMARRARDGNKGSEGEIPPRGAPPNTEVAVKRSPEEGGAARPVALCGETRASGQSWEESEAKAFGESSLALSATSTSPPKAEKPSSVPPSSPGYRVGGGGQRGGAGAVVRLPSRALGLCGRE